jgi:hypothetical protein
LSHDPNKPRIRPVRSIFEIATRLGTTACAMVDSDLRSITPYWLDRLLSPIVHHGYEYVAPVYSRHKYDGTITNSIAYPVTTALYGVRLRQPIGGEFGLSGELRNEFAHRRRLHPTGVRSNPAGEPCRGLAWRMRRRVSARSACRRPANGHAVGGRYVAFAAFRIAS